MSCSAFGDPVPEIRWFLDGQPIVLSYKYYTGRTGNFFNIQVSIIFTEIAIHEIRCIMNISNIFQVFIDLIVFIDF